MANEATVNSSMVIRKQIGSGGTKWLDYRGQPTSFQADVNGTKGPVPGAFTASLLGTDVDLSELDAPGLCRIQNLDSTNYVTIGISDPDTMRFHVLLEVLPGESYIMRLSRNLTEEWGTMSGSGTMGPAHDRLCIKANGAPCNVLVEAFEA